MLLNKFPDCSARTLAEAEQRVDANAKGSVFEVPGKDKSFLFEVNVAKLGDVTLISAGCDVACRLTWVPAGFVRQTFQLRGQSNLFYDRSASYSDPSEPGCLIPAGTSLRIENSAQYESLTMRISPDALKNKLSAIIGEELRAPEFDYRAPLNIAGIRSLRLVVLELARTLDQVGAYLSSPALNELAQIAVVRFLLYHKHTYSDRLIRRTASPSERQLEQIEDYLSTYWDQPLELEKLAGLFNIGARTIHRLFVKRRGTTPSQMLRRIRLTQARMQLLSSNEASVLEIAKQCGFCSFGHFAREYRQAFGELPLQTLRHRTSMSRRRMPSLKH